MINGAHFILYSEDPEGDRAFLRDVVGFPSVDAGRGWLIFSLPPAEFAVHPTEEGVGPPNEDDGVAGVSMYLMCDDLRQTMNSLKARKASFSPVEEAPWGTVTAFALPSGARIGLYQPKHPTALELR